MRISNLIAKLEDATLAGYHATAEKAGHVGQRIAAKHHAAKEARLDRLAAEQAEITIRAQRILAARQA